MFFFVFFFVLFFFFLQIVCFFVFFFLDRHSVSNDTCRDPLYDREVVGWIPDLVIRMTLKLYKLFFCLALMQR